MTQTLLAADLRGIQAFVYSSRQLLDAVGRAAQVDELTDPTQDRLREMLSRHGGQVLIAGAGGLLLAFPEQDSARDFAATWTRWIYDTTDQLNAVLARLPGSDTGEVPHPSVVSAALRRARAGSDPLHEPALNPGFLSRCVVSGRPAALLPLSADRGPELLAREIVDARQAGRTWHARQNRELLAGVRDTGPGWTLTTQLDALGRQSGELSKLAVVHADINGLGSALSRHADLLATPPESTDSATVTPMRAISQLLTATVQALHTHLIASVVSCATQVDNDWWISGFPARLAVPTATSGARQVVPIRPVVAAGDDLTVVCDARLAWSLTRIMLRWLDTPVDTLPVDDPRRRLAAASPVFRRAGVAGPLVDLTVGVGIATFPVGAPVATAYDAAADMCRWAKGHRTEQDWTEHVVAWARPDRPPVSPVSAVQGRRTVGLTCQPYPGAAFNDMLEHWLGDTPGSLRSTTHPLARSWVKSLHTLVEQGPAALHLELSRRDKHSRGGPPPELASRLTAGRANATDWVRRPTPFLDAVELLDLHLDLDPEGNR